MFDFHEMKSNLHKALTKIGNKNGTAPPISQDPIDEKLHKLYVYKYAENFFEKARKKVQEGLLNDPVIDGKMTTIVAAVTSSDTGEKNVIAAGGNYQFDLEVRKPVKSLDKDKLKAKLMSMGWTLLQVNKLIDDCSKTNSPARVMNATPIG